MHRPARERRTPRRMLATLTALAIAAGAVGLDIAAESPAAASVVVNGKIAFGRWNAELDDSQVFTINPDGTGEQMLPTPFGAGSPRWSPDGTKISVELWLDGVRSAVMNPDGSGLKMLDPSPALELTCQAWSPDGKRLACAGFGGDPAVVDGVYTIRAKDGGDLKQITTFPNGTPDGQFTNDIPIGYSSDGSRILFDRNADNDLGDLFVVNTDGSNLTQLNPDDLIIGSGSGASWSPDGTRVAFAAFWKLSSARGSGSALFVVNADGKGLRQITPSGLGASAPRWSPDGQLIAFNDKRRGDRQIYLVHPDGTGLTGLTTGNNDTSFHPVWSPDGTKLVFERVHSVNGSDQEDLWMMNADGSGLFQLTDTPESEGSQEWGASPVS